MKISLAILLVPAVVVLSSCSQFNTNTSSSEAAEDAPTLDMAVADTSGSPVVRDTATQHRRLPTLREQMQRIEERQAAMQEDIGFIKNDLTVLKDEVVQLRNAITSGKPVVTETEAVKGPSVTRSATELAKKDEEPTPATVLLSDEDAAEKEETVPRRPTKPQRVAPRQEQKSAPVTIQSDEQVKATETSKQPATKERETTPTPVIPSDKYKEAMQYVAKKEYDKAAPLLEDVLKNDRNPVTRGNALYWLGEGAYAGGEYEKAIEHFKGAFAIKSSTKADDALLMMAEAYRKMGKTDDARKTYNRLIDTYPQSEFVARARKMLQML
jgi:tol-pal system protein YbgF